MRFLWEAGERAGIQNPNPKYKNLTCHLFRHSFAGEWKKQGGPDEYGTEDLEEVQENYERMMGEMF